MTSFTIGHVEAIFRYPVKSMAGEPLDSANLGWHGLDGDRRLAFRRMEDRGGFPWLTAGKLPDLILFAPKRREDSSEGHLPTHVRTPDGQELPIFSEELAADVARRYGAPVQMMQWKHGIFDEANISVIASETVWEISRLAGLNPDVRRFRPNILVRLLRPVPFQEDEWVGGVLSFGEGDAAPAVTVTLRDERCAMLNLDPDSARPTPAILKAVVHAHQNTAGIYATVTRIGRLAVGQPITLHPLDGRRAGLPVHRNTGTSSRRAIGTHARNPHFALPDIIRGRAGRDGCGLQSGRYNARPDGGAEVPDG